MTKFARNDIVYVRFHTKVLKFQHIYMFLKQPVKLKIKLFMVIYEPKTRIHIQRKPSDYVVEERKQTPTVRGMIYSVFLRMRNQYTFNMLSKEFEMLENDKK